MPTCNWLGLETLGSQPIMPKNLPIHCTNEDIRFFDPHPPTSSVMFGDEGRFEMPTHAVLGAHVSEGAKEKATPVHKSVRKPMSE